jgi:hypothetical protein
MRRVAVRVAALPREPETDEISMPRDAAIAASCCNRTDSGVAFYRSKTV